MRAWKLMALVGTTVIALGAPLRAQDGRPTGTFDLKSGRFGRNFGEAQRPPDTLTIASSRVWAALPAVYAALDIPLSVADTGSHVIGAMYLSRRRPIGGERLSRLLSCGDSSFGPNADHYEVQFTALSLVTPIDSAHSALTIAVNGVALANGNSQRIACNTTGRLERRILEELRKISGS
ncbi:MAG: hypothetical protein ACJ8AD_05445 [Gemmatimonadaceae bacterium]